MIVFFGDKVKFAVPESRIFNIIQSGNIVKISYSSGEITWLGDSGDSVAPKIENYLVKYESEELAIKNFRDYYVACETRKGAFYFG